MLIEEVTFHKKPILVISTDDKKRILFSAGLNKINLILNNIEALKAFADKYKVVIDNNIS
jgi:hypothetical protein